MRAGRIDERLFKDIRRDLLGKDIRWVIGGSCSGKTTLCRALAEREDLVLYDMDEHIFGFYTQRYTEKDCPANNAWFSAPDPLDWALSLSAEDFDAFNREANLEYLRLFAEDMVEYKADRLILVDGGISYPAMLARVVPPENILCLEVTAEESELIWETAGSKKSMKERIAGLPEADKKWKRFLECNRLITGIILMEARDRGIRVLGRDSASVDRIKDFLAGPREWA